MCELFRTLLSADVLKGEYRGQKVAVKSLKDNTHAAQQFLTEASLMTYVAFVLLYSIEDR